MNNPNSVRGIPPRNAESFDFKGEPGSPNAAPSATDPRARLYDGSITSSGPAARQVVGRNEERVFFLDTVATGDVAVNEVTPPVHANNSRQVVVTTRIREVAVMLLVLLVEVDCRRGGSLCWRESSVYDDSRTVIKYCPYETSEYLSNLFRRLSILLIQSRKMVRIREV